MDQLYRETLIESINNVIRESQTYSDIAVKTKEVMGTSQVATNSYDVSATVSFGGKIAIFQTTDTTSVMKAAYNVNQLFADTSSTLTKFVKSDIVGLIGKTSIDYTDVSKLFKYLDLPVKPNLRYDFDVGAAVYTDEVEHDRKTFLTLEQQFRDEHGLPTIRTTKPITPSFQDERDRISKSIEYVLTFVPSTNDKNPYAKIDAKLKEVDAKRLNIFARYCEYAAKMYTEPVNEERLKLYELHESVFDDIRKLEVEISNIPSEFSELREYATHNANVAEFNRTKCLREMLYYDDQIDYFISSTLTDGVLSIFALSELFAKRYAKTLIDKLSDIDDSVEQLETNISFIVSLTAENSINYEQIVALDEGVIEIVQQNDAKVKALFGKFAELAKNIDDDDVDDDVKPTKLNRTSVIIIGTTCVAIVIVIILLFIAVYYAIRFGSGSTHLSSEHSRQTSR